MTLLLLHLLLFLAHWISTDAGPPALQWVLGYSTHNGTFLNNLQKGQLIFVNATLVADPSIFNASDVFMFNVVFEARRMTNMYLYTTLPTVGNLAYGFTYAGTLAVLNAGLATLEYHYEDEYVLGETRVTFMYMATVISTAAMQAPNTSYDGVTIALNTTSHIPASSSIPSTLPSSFNALIDEIAIGLWSSFLFILLLVFVLLLFCLKTVIAMARLYRFRRYKARMAAAGTPLVLAAK